MLDADIRKLLDTAFAVAPDATAPDVTALRLAAERAPALFGDKPEAVKLVRDTVAVGTHARRVPVRVYDPSDVRGKPLVVFAHGGGWVTGSLDSHDRLCRMLANRLEAVVVAVGYACAPENRYPAALDDVDAAWHWCREEARSLAADSSRMAVAGDSAGGNLAAALTLRLRSRREAQPAVQLLLYPALDARAASESYATYASGHNLTADMMRWHWSAYAPQADVNDPYLSPLSSDDLSGLAPLTLASIEADVLRDDGLNYARRLEQAGVPVHVVRCPGMIHGFLRWSGAVPAVRPLVDAICAAAKPLLQRTLSSAY
ncbi:MAG TPA: alpha/beta hydrolase [Casimicrobiaceae bacterium]|nr:alpha/beta hydrolase [Casimicrobiaceae bacterium]